MILLDHFLQKSALVGNENRLMKASEFKQELAENNFEYIHAPGFDLLKDIRVGESGISSALVEADFAISETGTVVLDSSNENKRLATCLAEKLYVIVPLSKLVDSLHDVAGFLEMKTSGMGGYVAFITGSSRTADIERVLTVGVHGPKEMILYILTDL